MRIIILAALPIALSGCVVGTVASTAVDVVTLPVKAASSAVDAATTSQSEADQNRGRQIREYEECVGKEQRRAERERRDADLSRCQE